MVSACGKSRDQPPIPAPDLAVYLHGLAGRDEPTRSTAVATWLLSRDEWTRIVVEPYRSLHDDYVVAFDAAKATFVEQLEKSRPIVVRAHFAGDPTATHAQSVTRWALPTLAPSKLAELGGQPPIAIDAVFVEVGGSWRAIVGLGAIVRRRVAAFDATCALALDQIEPAGGPCIEAAWAVADAALRDDRARFMHSCGLAANLCGKRSQ